MVKKNAIYFALMAILMVGCNHSDNDIMYNDSLPPVTEGYVGLQDGHFVLDGEEWFPKMLNYKAFIRRVGDSLEVVPADYYHGRSIEEHFDTIASWGFNAIRICLDVLDGDMDSCAMFRATRRVIQEADSAGLKVMLLIKTPFDPYWQSYTKGLLRHLADLPALWAYDFFNEPLYFDPEPERDKMDATRLVSQWRHWVRQYAPHQLFTIATAEPIEVFEWDPALLPVDFIEMHTYHPLRVFSEMWWYSHYCGKPWMIGETGLPADNDSVPYKWQFSFMDETYVRAKLLGAIGYGWWEFQDNPQGVNFEAQYTGLSDANGKAKLAADRMRYRPYICMGCAEVNLFPVNYYNMLAYSNICLKGMVVDENNSPVEGAVIRGWNDDWSVGMNTYTDSNGRFTLYSNDYNVHFEVSAPRMSHQKFDRRNIRYSNPKGIDTKNLPDRQREYQQIDYKPYLNNSIPDIPFNMDYDSTHFFRFNLEGDMGTIKLKTL
ncbi:MAG: carboxypeptidase-like regulatory domain-containing protein [Bacteroidales bacterium]|nr:carboxypeptidase-like regulatory domain-containing protein [Bacteroidales bacterium]